MPREFFATRAAIVLGAEVEKMGNSVRLNRPGSSLTVNENSLALNTPGARVAFDWPGLKTTLTPSGLNAVGFDRGVTRILNVDRNGRTELAVFTDSDPQQPIQGRGSLGNRLPDQETFAAIESAAQSAGGSGLQSALVFHVPGHFHATIDLAGLTRTHGNEQVGLVGFGEHSTRVVNLHGQDRAEIAIFTEPATEQAESGA